MDNKKSDGAYKRSAARPGARSARPSEGFPKKPYVKKARWVPRTGASTGASTARSYAPKYGASAPSRAGVKPRTSSDGASRPYTPRNTSSTPRPYTKRTPGAFGRPEQREQRGTSPRSSPYPKLRSNPLPSKPPRVAYAAYAPKNPTTSWGEVATWYDKHLTSKDTYHEKVILPNLLRLVEPGKNETILDLACGQGYFARALTAKGARVIGLDISEELIAIAKQESADITYHIGSAEKLDMIPDTSIDKVIIVLAIQNIAHVARVFNEAERVLKEGGVFHIVMNHPAFRIPKQSSWEYDEQKKVQVRRIDQYISESATSIDMHPGMKDSPQTISFHRPLQYYFKAFMKAGFVVDRLEEWISHKESDSGPRAQAENKARKEIPLFLYLRAKKLTT